MMKEGFYGDIHLAVGTPRESAFIIHSVAERRRGLRIHLLSAISHMKSPDELVNALVEETMMQKVSSGASVSQRVAFIRALQGVNWGDVLTIEDPEYADDRRAKSADPVMQHYI
jgi:hypothetical protein